MKKTLIASAVALATFASAGVSAQEVNLPKIYGNIQLTVANEYFKAAGAKDGQDAYDFVDNGSTLGITHEHEVSPGYTAFFKAEFEFNATGDDTDGDGWDNLDEAYIGIKGDFGQIWAGKDDSVYEWVDVTDLYEYLGVPGELTDTRESRLIQYATPSLGGLTLGVAYQMNDARDREDAFQLAAKYELGDTTIVAAFDSGANADENANSYGLAVTHTLGDLTLAAQYEQQEDNLDIFGVLGAYTMGKTVLMGSYHFSKYDAKGAEDAHTISLQALHNLSDNFYVYVEGQYVDNVDGDDGAEANTLALGATYVF